MIIMMIMIMIMIMMMIMIMIMNANCFESLTNFSTLEKECTKLPMNQVNLGWFEKYSRSHVYLVIKQTRLSQNAGNRIKG